RGAADQVLSDCQPQDRESTWAHDPGTVPSACRRGHRMTAKMKRREFITLLGAAAAWPLAARAQQGERVRRIGVLLRWASDDPEGQARIGAFLQGLQQSGWIIGRNIRIDARWSGGDGEAYRRQAAEVAASTPDVILATGAAAVGPLLQATRTVPIVFVI